MELRRRLLACLGCLGVCVPVVGQTTTRTEVGGDGVTYRVTENTWQQSVPYTDYDTRTERTLQSQQTEQIQTFQQTYAVPVTEYKMVSRYRGWWNPFAQPYWTHQMVPMTRWDYRAATVQMPVAQNSLVEGTRTVQVPITRYRTVENTSTSRVAVSVPAGVSTPSTLGPGSSAPVVASRAVDGRYGSERLSKDPPREPSRFSEGATQGSFRR